MVGVSLGTICRCGKINARDNAKLVRMLHILSEIIRLDTMTWEQEMAMTSNCMTWNIRRARSREKATIMTRKVRKYRLLMIAIQETKLQTVTEEIVNHIWGNKECEWITMESLGASGGLLTLWDNNRVELVASIEG